MATGIPTSNRSGEPNGGSYHLSYTGKAPVEEILRGERARLRKILTVEGEFSNRLIYGENLRILRTLLDDPKVTGKVRLIYIDPPYATRSRFESREQEDAYEDTVLGSHYLEFLRQRLILLREILAEDGSIYVHLDNKMAFPVKVLMDEIFGAKNLRNWITRKKCNPKNYTRKQYGNVADYILFYTKNANYVWNQQFDPWTEDQAMRWYGHIEKESGRRYMRVPIHAPGVRRGETGKEWRGMKPPQGKHWQFTPDKLDEMDARGEIYWSPNGNPRRKIYLDESKGIPVQDIWLDFRDAHNQNIYITGYPTEKNPDLLKRIIRASSNQGDLVLDAFAGSGTAAAASEDLGRRWIAIDNSLLAMETMIWRLAKGTEPMGDFVQVQKKERKAKPLSLFSRVLQTSLDVFVEETDDIERPSDAQVEEWKELLTEVTV